MLGTLESMSSNKSFPHLELLFNMEATSHIWPLKFKIKICSKLIPCWAWCMPLISVLQRQGQVDLSEFEVSLVSRIARQTLPQQTNQLNNKNTSKQMVPQSHQPHNHM